MIVIDQGGEWLWQKVQNIPNFSGQMLWSFHFATIFSQTDTDIFFAIMRV